MGLFVLHGILGLPGLGILFAEILTLAGTFKAAILFASLAKPWTYWLQRFIP